MAYETSEEGRQNLMDISAPELARLLEQRFTGKRKNMKPILIVGKAGVGKTEIVYQVVKKLGIGLKEVVLAEYESTDIAGLPKIMERQDLPVDYETQNDSERYMVEHIRPRLLPDAVKAKYALDQHKKMYGLADDAQIDIMSLPEEARKNVAGILFFDEVSAACKENRIAVSKLLDKSRRVGDYELPEHWLVVCACNGPEDAGAYDDLEPMFFNRCQAFRYEPDDESWIKWAVNAGVDPSIIAFIKAYPDLLWDKVDSIYGGAFPSPRAWTDASVEIQAALADKPEGTYLTPREIALNISGYVGNIAAQKFAGFYILHDSIIPMSDIEAGIARTNVNDYNREANYLQASIVAQGLLKAAAEYNSAPSKDMTKLKNILNWVGEFASHDLHAATELIREALHSQSSPLFIFMIANFSLLKTYCPKFVDFYNEHSDMFQNM